VILSFYCLYAIDRYNMSRTDSSFKWGNFVYNYLVKLTVILTIYNMLKCAIFATLSVLQLPINPLLIFFNMFVKLAYPCDAYKLRLNVQETAKWLDLGFCSILAPLLTMQLFESRRQRVLVACCILYSEVIFVARSRRCIVSVSFIL
jgi:hypothetical protein